MTERRTRSNQFRAAAPALFAAAAFAACAVSTSVPCGTWELWGEEPEQSQNAQASFYEQVLARYAVQADAASLREYLAALHGGPQVRKQTAAMIARLNSPQFSDRQTSTQQLLRMPMPAVDLLRAAEREGEPEVRWRAKVVLEDVDRRREEVLYAVFKTIQQRKLAGLAEPLLSTLPLVTKEHLFAEGRKTIVATSSSDDEETLRRSLAAGHPRVRIAALAALDALPEMHAEEDAARLLGDSDESVRVAAARTLAAHGDRRSLAELEKLLGAEELAVRVEAVRTLRALTGQQFAFTAYAGLEQREASREQWREWIAASGATAELHLPLQSIGYELGRTLICNHGEAKVREYDAQHKLVWEQSVGQHPWSCQGLANGHRLVASYGDRNVVEYDESGKEVWRADGLPGGPTSVERLENGNTLIACTDGQEVVEVDRGGKVVWKVQLGGRPVKAQRLENGRTLVVLETGDRIVEVNHEGTVVWELVVAENPFSAQRLENGNTLVCCMSSGEVCEYDRSHQVVWKHNGLKNPYDAQRTAAGTTLIVDMTGVTEIDREKKVVWRLQMSNVSRACRF